MAKQGNRPSASPVPVNEVTEQPTIPPHPQGKEWSAYAQRYWDEVWASEAVQYWRRSDLILLERCLLMVQQIAEGEATTATLSELRRTEESLFLSPGSRQRSRIGVQAEGSAPKSEEDELRQKRRERLKKVAEGG